MQLDVKAINLLRHVLSTDGKKIEQNGKEVFNPRTLNGFESSQRRHFFKKTDVFLNAIDEELKKMQEEHNEKVKVIREKIEVENPKKEGEEDDKYSERINVLVVAFEGVKDGLEKIEQFLKEKLEVKNEVELEKATLDVVKKYFKVYGDEVGFSQDSDEVVEDLVKLLA